jgi:hypothetical protein
LRGGNRILEFGLLIHEVFLDESKTSVSMTGGQEEWMELISLLENPELLLDDDRKEHLLNQLEVKD